MQTPQRWRLELSAPPAAQKVAGDTTFVLSYTKTKAQPPARAIEYEKTFPTLWAALNFCVQLADLGGECLTILRYIGVQEGAVLDGNALAEAIRKQRARIAGV
jgi:hypothetical protein